MKEAPPETLNQFAPKSDRAPIRILLIEDNPGDAHLIKVMLMEVGGEAFVLERVERLSQGLERLAEGGIDIVLLDLSLPDSQGLESFAKVHQASSRVPIIVLSGLNDEKMALEAVHGGAQDYLVKGQVDGPLLVRAIRYAIERRHVRAELESVAEELRAKNKQLEADLNMAREIQQIFLPDHYPTFPRTASPQESALRFYHRYIPAAAVSGDFFSVLAISDTLAGVFICDVMGHGLRAALVTAIMRGLIEELMPLAAEPGGFVTEVNRSMIAILKRTDEPLLATAFYLVADVVSGEVQFSSAGHPSPFRVRQKSGTVERFEDYDPKHGPALGLFEKSTYPTCRGPISAGDLLLLFTDGLYEVHGPDNREYGQERLLHAVEKRASLPSPQLIDSVLEDTQRFSEGEEFEDDVCLVGVEVARVGKGGRDA